MIGGIAGGACGKQNRKLFTTYAEGLATSTDPRQLRGHQPQDLVSGVMAVIVVDVLEVVDVHNSDRKRMLQAQERIIEGAAGVQACQFVLIGQWVGVLNDATSQYEAGHSEIRGSNSPRRPGFQT